MVRLVVGNRLLCKESQLKGDYLLLFLEFINLTFRGLIPRSFEHIFESISVTENTKFLVRASYLEIYNEEIRDLLATNNKQKLDLKENPDRGVYVKDCVENFCPQLAFSPF